MISFLPPEVWGHWILGADWEISILSSVRSSEKIFKPHCTRKIRSFQGLRTRGHKLKCLEGQPVNLQKDRVCGPVDNMPGWGGSLLQLWEIVAMPTLGPVTPHFASIFSRGGWSGFLCEIFWLLSVHNKRTNKITLWAPQNMLVYFLLLCHFCLRKTRMQMRIQTYFF